MIVAMTVMMITKTIVRMTTSVMWMVMIATMTIVMHHQGWLERL